MKILSKIICSLLATVFSFSCFACSDNNKKGENPVKIIEETGYTGVHDFTATETNDYLVKDGTTDYILVYTTNDNVFEENAVAKSEFLRFFQEATGVRLRSVVDTGLTWDSNSKYISLGENELTKSAGIDVNEVDLNDRGARIVTKGKSIFLYGSTEEGTLNAVYDFLELEFNFDIFYVDNYVIDTDVKNVKLKNYDVTDVPDIAHVAYGNYSMNPSYSGHSTEDEKYYGYRCRRAARSVLMNAVQINSTQSNRIGAQSMHNSFTLLPREVYMQDHRGWYSDDARTTGHTNAEDFTTEADLAQGQLCYTAHGDAEELKLMKETMVETIKLSFECYPKDKYPYANAMAITIQDGTYNCKCDACKATATKYTSESVTGGSWNAAVILFMNDVAKMLNEWIDTLDEDSPSKREDFVIYIFAYGNYNDAPVTYNEELGVYQPISEEVRPNEHLGVWYCAQKGQNASLYWADNRSSQIGLSSFKMQSDLFDNFILYTYSGNAYNTFDMKDFSNWYNSEFFRLAQAANTYYLYDDNRGNVGTGNHTAPAFSLLKNYLFNKLTWNAKQDDAELTLKFFKAMYKDGWEEVYEMYLSLRMLKVGGSSEDGGNGAEAQPISKEMYRKGLLDTYFGLLEKAKAKNEKYKGGDPELYERLMFYIDVEWMSPAYFTIEYYSDYYNTEELSALKKKFIEVGTKMKMGHTGSKKFSNYIAAFA